MKKLSFYNLFYIFIIASVCGWFIEGCWSYLRKGILINHSALVIGPFNLIYGCAAILLTITLFNIKNKSIIKIFVIGLLMGTLIEYLMSLGMEVFFGFTAWDYSQKFLNINGRVCLLYSIFWGFLSILWIFHLYPFLNNFLNKKNFHLKKILAIILMIFLLFDGTLTINALMRVNKKDEGILPQNKYEEFLDKYFNKDYLNTIFNNKIK